MNRLLKKKRGRTEAGFTLVEIMIALAILAVGILSLYTAQGNSLRASGHAERIQTASMLAKRIMTEKMLELELDLAKGNFPDDQFEESGEFDEPYREYRWRYLVRRVDIPLAGGSTEQNQDRIQSEDSAQEVPESAQKSMVQTVTKKLGEALREVSITVIWEELGEEQKLTVTTHVSRL